MNSSDRLIQYLEHKGIAKNQFYVNAGISVGYLTKRPEMSTKILKIIVGIYKDLNLYWLVTGEGTMLKSGSDTGVSQKQADTPQRVVAVCDNCRSLQNQLNQCREINKIKEDLIKSKEETIRSMAETIQSKDELIKSKDGIINHPKMQDNSHRNAG